MGRTARYKSDGNSVLFIGQKEINFVNELELRKISITKIKIGQNKINNITPVVRSLLSEHNELIEIAEKAITSYIKSINLMNNKNVFNIKNIDLGKLALSYGLVSSPEMVVKSKKEVEEKIEEEENKIIDIKNKKIEEEKNLVKENLGSINTENKKKSKLFKLKEKIKLKKLMKQKEKEKEINLNEKKDFSSSITKLDKSFSLNKTPLVPKAESFFGLDNQFEIIKYDNYIENKIKNNNANEDLKNIARGNLDKNKKQKERLEKERVRKEEQIRIEKEKEKQRREKMEKERKEKEERIKKEREEKL